MTRDLRRYARQTNIRLLIGGLLIIFLVGIGLIYLFYGRSAALMGVVCMAAGLVPLALTWLILIFIGWIAKRANYGEE